MNAPIRTLSPAELPSLLKETPDPPQKLYYRGNLPPDNARCLAVVGSRNYSDYGKQAVESLIGGLRGYNIAIISGLAIGIDGLAHRAALDAGLYTLAIPGSGLDDSVLYPRRHRALAREILDSGGGLLSEYEAMFRATTWAFPKRNRIMAGLAHAVLVVEASQRSGTLITARLATDYNRDVLTVPSSIFSENGAGPHMLIRLGATPVASPEDILEAFGIEAETYPNAGQMDRFPPEEARVLGLLFEPKERDAVIRELGMDAAVTNVLLMKMEMNGLIRNHNGKIVKNGT